jgi:hypothetical protein
LLAPKEIQMSVVASERDVAARLNSCFQQGRDIVPVLRRRAEAEGITEIRALSDMVPLLFPHTTYKSYPEALIEKQQWGQMNRWLDSLSTHRVDNVDVSGVEDVDGWIDRLHDAGHRVSSSSGTSGKGSFLNKTARDGEVSLANLIDCLTAIGLAPEPVWEVLPVGPDTKIRHHVAIRELVISRYGRADRIEIPENTAPEGHHQFMSRLSAMRRAIADGSAKPEEIAAFEAESAKRQQNNEERLQYFALQMLVRRDHRYFFNATFPLLYRLCEILREHGASEGDFTAENALTTGGGLKGIALPPNYQSQIFALLNIAPSRFLHYYAMQELNVRLPKCLAGRYHVPDEVVLMVLNQDGDELAPVSDSMVEGRASFFDLTVDGRWGGTMSGDKILSDFGTCPCGSPGPTVLDEITRYSDLGDGDKITCAGTMDAYVRGFIES